MSDVVWIHGPYASAIREVIGEAWVADDLQPALAAAARVAAPIATLNGEVVRGPHLITGGLGAESHGILGIKREIKELRERIARTREEVEQRAEDLSALEASIAEAVAAVDALNTEQHRQEKAVLALELQLERVTEEADRLRQKSGVVDTERLSADQERRTIEERQAEARQSIARLEQEQRAADERLTLAQRRLLEAREALDGFNHGVAEGKASHAALTERAVALADDVQRLETAAAELEAHAAASRRDLQNATERREALATAIGDHTRQLDADMATLDTLRIAVRVREDRVATLRGDADLREASIRQARGRSEEARAVVSALDLERATAESHLTHLASSCIDVVQASLDDVLAEVERAEASGAIGVAPATPGPTGEDGEEDEDDEVGAASSAGPAAPKDPEDAIAGLRAKLDRLGAVNMMAIEQFDELSTRHTFLTTQRRDLVDSIAATDETIKRIDETTRQRFREAFDTINTNFQETFSTLFGGGKAGLTLIDEGDLLETGIEISAQPPGKRLQSVQLLSGGEKALTAISLMFAIFKYKPSPFCVLDEIDAPLDDANIGRFVEMLKGMLHHTQFILITHNRKTMEIADRLYGVTMEEPGVSKLISLRLN